MSSHTSGWVGGSHHCKVVTKQKTQAQAAEATAEAHGWDAAGTQQSTQEAAAAQEEEAAGVLHQTQATAALKLIERKEEEHKALIDQRKLDKKEKHLRTYIRKKIDKSIRSNRRLKWQLKMHKYLRAAQRHQIIYEYHDQATKGFEKSHENRRQRN